MLVNTNLTISYKCPVCGTFSFFSANLFKLLTMEKKFYECYCRCSSIKIDRVSEKTYKCHIPCIACGEVHTHKIALNKMLLKKDCITLVCPVTGVEHCIIGEESMVSKEVDRLEEELDSIVDTFGYDKYFKNTQVMLDALNRIHDIAEKDDLSCECENSDLEVFLSAEEITITCQKCNALKIFKASSNEDLKKIMNIDKIVLSKMVIKEEKEI